MNIKHLRAIMAAALTEAGLTEMRLFPKQPKVWALPGAEVVPFFAPSPYRRPWGFAYSGCLGLEVPALRAWLAKHRPGEKAGIFKGSFTGYYSANDSVLRSFMIEHGLPVPSDLWAGLIVDRLDAIPSNLSDLMSVYRSDRERLGWFADPHSRHAWNFLAEWIKDPDPALHVPTMGSDGRIA